MIFTVQYPSKVVFENLCSLCKNFFIQFVLLIDLMIKFGLLCRFAYFVKGGGDAYLFDMQFPNIPESVSRTHISVSNQ